MFLGEYTYEMSVVRRFINRYQIEGLRDDRSMRPHLLVDSAAYVGLRKAGFSPQYDAEN